MSRTTRSVHPPGVRSVAALAVMSRPVIVITASMRLVDALTALRAVGVRHLAVVDAAGRCVGVLSDRAIAAAWAFDPVAFAGVRVSSVLAAEPPVVNTSATIADVARTMRRHESDAVVVVDAEMKPAGVVTAGDLVALLAKPSLTGDRPAPARPGPSSQPARSGPSYR